MNKRKTLQPFFKTRWSKSWMGGWNPCTYSNTVGFWRLQPSFQSRLNRKMCVCQVVTMLSTVEYYIQFACFVKLYCFKLRRIVCVLCKSSTEITMLQTEHAFQTYCTMWTKLKNLLLSVSYSILFYCTVTCCTEWAPCKLRRVISWHAA